MAKRLSRKKALPRSKRTSTKAKRYVLVAALLVSLFIAVIYVQKPQTFRQHANTETTNVTKPVFGCLQVGGQQGCIGSDTDTFVSDPVASGSASCITIEEAKVEPAIVEQGQPVKATIKVKNTCFEGEEVPILFVKAAHAAGGVMDFGETSDFQSIIKDQTVTFTSEHTVGLEDVLGEWKATFYTRDSAQQEVAYSTQSSNLPFTVIEPCPGLEVSKALSLDKGRVNFGEAIKGSITYKNPCTSPYTVKNILIQVQKPGAGDAGTMDDFIPSLGQITIPPGAEQLVEGSLTIPVGACGESATCEWKAVGAYEAITPPVWRLDNTRAGFTIGAPPAQENGDPTASESGQHNGDPSASESGQQNGDPSSSESAKPSEPAPALPAKVVYFLFDSTVIRPEYYPALDDTTNYIKANTTARVLVVGHTDDVGTPEYNQGLSERRATAVKDHMVGNGADASRIDTQGKGETAPVGPNETPQERDKNRRTDITSL